MNDNGMVLELQRMSTEDGPGIRTTVFLKGCPLKCEWCHNPESISPIPQVHWLSVRCIGCGTCIKVCPRNAIMKQEGRLFIDRSVCDGCGRCADECPPMAMEMLGKKWSAEKLVEELEKDRAFFEKSNGGVTLSGGEVTLQPYFSADVLRCLKKKGIKTAIDTCGLCTRETFDIVLPHTDLVLYDLKEIDPGKHAAFTGSRNERILANLEYVATAGRDIWIRTPVIPGATATIENISGIGAFLADKIPGSFSRWELCAFNNLCRDKYERLGVDWKYAKTALMTTGEMDKLTEAAKGSGIKPELVHWTGTTRIQP